jgi:asparagine synthetase B (glutamine-hydrolysing)
MRKIEPQNYREFHELFVKSVAANLIPNKEVGLAMSGGIDSMSVFFALLELNHPFECYTFYQDGIESDDYLSSVKYCKQFNIPLNVIKLPSDVDSVYNDVKEVIPYCGLKLKKTKVETLRPLMYLFKESKHDTILNGSSGDDYQPYKRAVNVLYQKGGDELVLLYGYRRNTNFHADAYDELSQSMARTFNIEFVNCYSDPNIESYFLQFSLADLLKPHKHLVTSAFQNEFDSVGGFRKHSSYQVNAKITNVHDELLRSRYNKSGHKGIIGLYNEMKAELRQLTIFDIIGDE